jgi:hypothetical protein
MCPALVGLDREALVGREFAGCARKSEDEAAVDPGGDIPSEFGSFSLMPAIHLPVLLQSMLPRGDDGSKVSSTSESVWLWAVPGLGISSARAEALLRKESCILPAASACGEVSSKSENVSLQAVPGLGTSSAKAEALLRKDSCTLPAASACGELSNANELSSLWLINPSLSVVSLADGDLTVGSCNFTGDDVSDTPPEDTPTVAK